MGAATKILEKQVVEANREISRLNERIKVLEQEMTSVKEFMKESLVQGKCPPAQSCNQRGLLVQMAPDAKCSVGGEVKTETDCSRGPSTSKTVSTPKEMGGNGREEGGFIRLTEAEFKYKMNAGLCVRCDKRYRKSHKCRYRNLRPLVVKDEDEICDQEKKEEEEEPETVTGGAHQFKFLGKIGDREVIVFFGTAATHNFISRKLVNELQIPLERTRKFRVNKGAEGSEVCERVVLKTHGIEIVETFFPTNLGIADVVLGTEWLKSLGRATLQGNPMTLTFQWHGSTVTLRADPSLSRRNQTGLLILEWI